MEHAIKFLNNPFGVTLRFWCNVTPFSVILHFWHNFTPFGIILNLFSILQHLGLREVIALMGPCTSGGSFFGVPIRISVAFLAFPQECLRFLQVPRLGKYS